MPIYEYHCQACEEVFEVIQSISDAPKAKCDVCGGKLEKLISRSSFHLKGGGWYKDLYSSPKEGGTGSSTDSAASSAESTTSSDTATSAKPAASTSSDSGSSSTTDSGAATKPAGAKKAKDKK